MSAQEQEPTAGKDADSVIAQEVVRQDHQRVEAYLKRDIDTLNRILPDKYIFTRSFGFFNKIELIKAIESGELIFESFDRQYQDVNVYLNTAVAVGRDTVRGRYKGRDISGQFRFSNMYVLHDGQWQVVATHSTRLSRQDHPAEAPETNSTNTAEAATNNKG